MRASFLARALVPAARDLLAPLPSYEAETLPGVGEALVAGDATRAGEQAAKLADALARAGRTLGATP